MLIKISSKAQVALQETFAQPPAAPHDHTPAELPALLRQAEVTTVLASESPATGKLICELRLRTQTGAGIVGIERNGGSLINPGPDEELQTAKAPTRFVMANPEVRTRRTPSCITVLGKRLGNERKGL